MSPRRREFPAGLPESAFDDDSIAGLIARIEVLQAQVDELQARTRDAVIDPAVNLEMFNKADEGLTFSGRAWVNGVLHTGLNNDPNKPWVVIPLDGQVPFEDAGDLGGAPSPLPQNQEWFLKANTAGDIHVIGTR
jgi:hypothetical protein